MTIYEREETYVHDTIFRNESGSYYDPDSVKITIKSPCNTILVNDASMTKEDTGMYTYSYSLSSDAIYGQYNVYIKSDIGGDITIETNKFFLMPYDIQDEVRSLTGQIIDKIDDDDLSMIVWYSFRETMSRVMAYHYMEKLCCCINGICSSCGKIECEECNIGLSSPICSDGYRLKHVPIADFQMDNNVHGCECDDASDECHNDICCLWIDEDGVCHDGSVEVVNSTCGEIKVYQSDCSTPIPRDNEGIYVNYHSVHKSYDSDLFKKAVAYLAAYELALRYNASSKLVTGCDEKSKVSFTDRLYERYERLIESISRPIIGGVK